MLTESLCLMLCVTPGLLAVCVEQVELRVRRLLLGLSANEIRSMMIRSASLTASSAALDIQLEMQKQILQVRALVTDLSSLSCGTVQLLWQ